MNKRRKFTAVEKAEIVRRHLWDSVAVSDLAQEYQVQPSQIHNWVYQAKQSLGKLFDRATGRTGSLRSDPNDQEIARLKAKLIQRHEVISELMEENVKAKKPMGTSERRLGPPRQT